ncbi:MAG: hypothetical protein ABF379_05925 [Akkermansiaceae bacterium]
MKFLFIAAILVGQLSAGSTSLRLYWTDKDLGLIQVSNQDGENRETVLSGLSDPRGIAVDVSQDKIFWAVHEANGAIWWANCDGTEAEVFIGSLNEPADLLLDSESRMIYWVSEGGGQIQRADLDGSHEVEAVVTGLVRPYYLELDEGFVYWSYFNSSVIERASINGGANRSVVISGQQRVRDLEIYDGVIYWCDRNSSQLRRREVDGIGGGTVLFSGGILDRPHGLVLDPISGTMYWTDTETQLIGSSSMDGSGSSTSLASTGLDGPWAIDLVRPVPLVDPYDAWQRDHFSDEDLADFAKELTLWGDDADPDSDGATNILEYAQGTDPNSLVVSSNTMSIASGEKVQVIFRMRSDDPDLDFTLEATKDLSLDHWDNDALTEVGERVLDPDNISYQLITMEADPKLHPRIFTRLRVSR